MEWVFQYNPRRYDLLEKLRNGTFNGWWNMRERRDTVNVADRVYFWQSGSDAALTVVGHVTSPAYSRESDFGKFAVDVMCDAVLEKPIRREEVLAIPELADVAVFRGWQGTNLLLSEAQGAALRTVVGARTRITLRDEGVHNLDSVATLGEAIARNNGRVKAELREIMQSMEARGFELLVRAVLLALGYRDVAVTQYIGDKGIDARGIFDIGGGTPVAVAVQAKRTKTVDRPVVQSLRESLTTHELGLLVTSGVFTAGAIEEARAPAKTPIGLIDGAKLIEIMTERGIGVSEKKFLALQLHRDQLTLEYLSADSSAM